MAGKSVSAHCIIVYLISQYRFPVHREVLISQKSLFYATKHTKRVFKKIAGSSANMLLRQVALRRPCTESLFLFFFTSFIKLSSG